MNFLNNNTAKPDRWKCEGDFSKRSHVLQIICLLCLFFAGSKLIICAQGASLESAALIYAWTSPTNFFSGVRVKVSRNNFLPENHPSYSNLPAEMSEIEGALLPKSFYIKYDQITYGGVFIQGESDEDYWSLGFKGLGKTSKTGERGGRSTNSLTIGIIRQKNYLRGWTQMGLIHVAPGTLQLNDTNFVASSPEGRTLKGNFTFDPKSGLPSAFQYEVSGPENFHVDGSIVKIEIQTRTYECLLSLWRGDDLWKKIKIICEEVIVANGNDMERVFNPQQLQIPQSTNTYTTIESNGVAYRMLTNGMLQTLKIKDSETERKRGRWARGILYFLLIISTAVMIGIVMRWKR